MKYIDFFICSAIRKSFLQRLQCMISYQASFIIEMHLSAKQHSKCTFAEVTLRMN